jgi:hypothetical protein
VTFFWFRKGELATNFPAANVYAAGIARVRPTTSSKFAVLGAIIATWATARHQLPAIFGRGGNARSSLTPEPIVWFQTGKGEKQTFV